MIPFYQYGGIFAAPTATGLTVSKNPCSAPVPRDEDEKAKEQYVAHRCSEFSGKKGEEGAGTKRLAEKAAAEAFSVSISPKNDHEHRCSTLR